MAIMAIMMKTGLGLIGTWLATEGVEDVNNPNLTHSINFQFSYPARHTGFGFSYPVTDTLTASVYLVNGWASFTDNNDAKSVGWQLSWNPTDKILMNFNGIHGAEKPGNNSDLTHLFTWAGYFTINDKLSFVANFNYGWTENNKIDTDGDGFNDAGALGRRSLDCNMDIY
ncbi:MAG: outer membrane beta-barrel protein [Candidatus Anammoxibacter sp.]